MRRILLIMAAMIFGGCSGEYILTAPDVAVLSGKDAPIVVRLQRREVWLYAPPQEGSAIIFGRGDKVLRSARTDKAGYAAVSIEAPQGPGRHEFIMYHQDTQGQTAAGRVFIYVFDPDRPVAVVDIDSLPWEGPAADQAAGALVRLRQAAQLVYVSEAPVGSFSRAHELLEDIGYPDGPVIPYSRPRWWRLRRSGDISALGELRLRLPKLQWGITADAGPAKAFSKAALKVLMVGKAKTRIKDVERFASWKDLKVSSTK